MSPSSAAAIPPGIELVAGFESERDDRLAERDDHDQRVPLGEMPGRQAPPAAAADVRAEQVDDERDRPDRRLEAAVEAGGDEEEPDADGRPDGEPGDRGEQVAVAPAGDDVEREVRDPDERVGAGEEERVVAERPRDGERRDQHRAHGGEHRDSNRPLFGVDRVRQPRVGGPRPPEHREDEHALDEAGPGRIVDDETGHLRQREDEDQVEEELERRHPLLGALLPLAPARPPSKPILRHAGSSSSDLGRRAQRDPVDGTRARRPDATRSRPPTPPGRSCCRARAAPPGCSRPESRRTSGSRSAGRSCSTGRGFAARRAGALAGLAIAALDLGLVGRRFPRIRALPLVPQLADHAAFGAIAARLLQR